MIDAIKFSALRNNEYTQFMQNFLNVVQRYDPSALLVQDEYNKLLSLVNTIKGMLNEGTGSVVTDDLIALDSRRDEAINDILALVNGYTYSPDPAKKAAANLLTNHLAGFGNIARDSYQSETSKLQKLVADFTNQTDLASAITALDLGSWKTEMEAANIAFDT